MARKKRKKIKKIYWLLIGLAILAIIIIFLFHRPGRYDPPQAVSNGQVSKYLTHNLLAQLYNGMQRNEPFDLIVTEEGINDIIVRSKWPKAAGDSKFEAPVVMFIPDRIILMGTATAGRLEFVVTLVAEAILSADGLMHLRITKAKVGAMNVTLFLKLMGRRIYQKQAEAKNIQPDGFREKAIRALFSDEPFEPVFTVEDKTVRIEKVSIMEKKLIIRIAPAAG